MAQPTLKLVGGAPHGWGVWIQGTHGEPAFWRVDISQIRDAVEAKKDPSNRLRASIFRTGFNHAINVILNEVLR